MVTFNQSSWRKQPCLTSDYSERSSSRGCPWLFSLSLSRDQDKRPKNLWLKDFRPRVNGHGGIPTRLPVTTVEISRPGSEAEMMEALSLWPLATIHERCQIIPLNRESFGHEAPKHCHTNREEHTASLDHGNTTHCAATWQLSCATLWIVSKSDRYATISATGRRTFWIVTFSRWSRRTKAHDPRAMPSRRVLTTRDNAGEPRSAERARKRPRLPQVLRASTDWRPAGLLIFPCFC